MSAARAVVDLGDDDHDLGQEHRRGREQQVVVPPQRGADDVDADQQAEEDAQDGEAGHGAADGQDLGPTVDVWCYFCRRQGYGGGGGGNRRDRADCGLFFFFGLSAAAALCEVPSSRKSGDCHGRWTSGTGGGKAVEEGSGTVILWKEKRTRGNMRKETRQVS